MLTSRGRFVRSIAAAGAAGCIMPALGARADDLTTVRVGALPIDNGAEPFYGADMGFFKKAGLDVQITVFPSGGAGAAALAGGALDFGITDSVSMAAAHVHGIPISYVAPATLSTNAAPAYTILVSAASPIKTAKDFNGKTVAVNGIKNILQIPFEAWLDNNGGDPKSVRFIEMPFASMAGAIDNGTIDGASVSEPFITNALQTGKFRAIAQTDRGLAPVFAFSGWTVQNDWAAKNPDAVKKFVVAMEATAKWANANHPASAQILVKNTKMPADIASKLMRVQFGERLQASYFQPVFDAAAKYGVIAASFPAAETFNPAAVR
jgi:ABC-type nitrate/sulfonate/bicarbonate transport system substrate-binding protein